MADSRLTWSHPNQARRALSGLPKGGQPFALWRQRAAQGSRRLTWPPSPLPSPCWRCSPTKPSIHYPRKVGCTSCSTGCLDPEAPGHGRGIASCPEGCRTGGSSSCRWHRRLLLNPLVSSCASPPGARRDEAMTYSGWRGRQSSSHQLGQCGNQPQKVGAALHRKGVEGRTREEGTRRYPPAPPPPVARRPGDELAVRPRPVMWQ